MGESMPPVAELAFCLTGLFLLEAGCDLMCLNNVSLEHLSGTGPIKDTLNLLSSKPLIAI